MHDLLDTQPHRYKVGEVDLEVNHSHENKIRILKMQMDNWSSSSNNSRMPLDSPIGRQYDADIKRTDHLFGMLKTGTAKNLTKDEMREMNTLFKRYGGIRKK